MVGENLVRGSSLFSKIMIFVVILFILSNIIIIFLEKKNISESLYNVGETFFISTKTLAEQSQKIVANQGALDFSNGFKGFLNNSFLLYSKIFLAFLSIIFWINIIAKMITYLTPLTNSNSPFVTYLLAVIFFYFFQLIFILGYAGMTGQINGFIGHGSVLYYISLPIFCFWDFIKAIPYIISPIRNIVDSSCNELDLSGVCKV